MGCIPLDGLFKPPVDLLDDVVAGAVVGFHGLDGDAVSGSHLIEELFNSAPEAVEGLLGVADVKEGAQLALPLTREDLIDQRLEEEKLEGGSVLKLIEEDMVKPCIEPKIEKLSTDALMQKPISEVGQIVKPQHPPKLRLRNPGVAVVVVEGKQIT